MNILKIFKKNKVESQVKSEIELLNIELASASSEFSYAKLVLENAQMMDNHDFRYMLHKRWFVKYAESNLKDAKLKLKLANIRRADELKMQSDQKSYELRRAASINANMKLRIMERIMRGKVGDSVTDEILNEVDDILISG